MLTAAVIEISLLQCSVGNVSCKPLLEKEDKRHSPFETSLMTDEISCLQVHGSVKQSVFGCTIISQPLRLGRFPSCLAALLK